MRLIFVCFVALLQGCVASQSFPTIARSGDTITIAVGSPDGMTKDNTQAEFVHNDGAIAPIPLSIRSIIRLNPDSTSELALFDPDISSMSSQSKHGAWLTIMIIDLPNGMPIGAGQIRVDTPASYFGASIVDYPPRLTIVEGQGSPSSFLYHDGFNPDQPGDLSVLEPLEQVVVTPRRDSPYYILGAAEIVINVVMRRIANPSEITPDEGVRVVMDHKYKLNNQDQTHMSWRRAGDQIRVNFISAGANGMDSTQTRFSVVLRGNGTVNQYVSTLEPSIESITYYDVNGDVLESGAPYASNYLIYRE